MYTHFFLLFLSLFLLLTPPTGKRQYEMQPLDVSSWNPHYYTVSHNVILTVFGQRWL